MRVLITGHDGYIGSILAPMVRAAGHDVVGLDSFLFEGCTLGPETESVPAHRLDVRDIEIDDLRDFDALIHLAAISNDPLGWLDPVRTLEINHLATVRIARLAKQAAIERFLFASSCSLYGASSSNDLLTEAAPLLPVTPYGESKVLAERDLSRMADDHFSPVFLRNATVYGYSPRLRLDLVLNDFVANAYATGRIVVKSDGTPWRPLVHVEDVGRAVLAAMEAPRESVHSRSFNVGRTQDNFQVREIADIVSDQVPGASITYAEDGGPDPRCYRVDFSSIEGELPGYRPEWTVSDGVRQLVEAYSAYDLVREDLSSSRFIRLRRIQALQDESRVAPDLRPLPAPWAAAAQDHDNRDTRASTPERDDGSYPQLG
jgi:nucleoside-diphosphate-sugar epimerase